MQRNHLRMAKIVNEVGLSRTQKYPNYSVTMSWDRDCCVYRTVIKWNNGKKKKVKSGCSIISLFTSGSVSFPLSAAVIGSFLHLLLSIV